MIQNDPKLFSKQTYTKEHKCILSNAFENKVGKVN